MATLLANPAKMIERGAPHVIHSEEQLEAYTKALYQLTAEPRLTAAQVKAIELLTLRLSAMKRSITRFRRHPRPMCSVF